MSTVPPDIETARLLLRRFRADDVDAVFAMRSRPDVTRYLYGDVLSRQQVVDLLAERAGMAQVRRDGDAMALAVERREDGRVIGDLTLWLRSFEHRQGEIGFVFHPDVHRQGYAREAVAALLSVAFDRVNLHRVVGRTDARNEASAGLMRSLGMRQEAHLRHNEIFKGEWGDELLFGLLEDEWRSAPRKQT
ncbi:MAG: GNAT family N-acetyltransferase [Pseudonocardiales bacterium]